MNVGKLKRVALKEFTRSPAKTGTLVVMLPVAMYVCVPLLFGAIKKPSDSKNATAVVDDSKRADFVAPPTAKRTATPSRVQQRWVEVERCLESDLFAKPVGLPSNVRNPFVAVGVEKNDESVAVVEGDARVVGSESEEEPESSVDQAVVTTNPIRDLGLELSATIVGQRSRLATINGKTYEEGEMIPVIIEAGSVPDEVTVLQLQLAHVDRRSVVLRMDGQEHLLQLRNEVPTDAIVVKPRRE